MNCKEVQNNLIFYIDNELDDVKNKIISEHLQTCDVCREKYEFLKQTMLVIDEQTEQQANPFIATRILAKAKEERRVNYMAKVLNAVAIVAMLIIAVLAGKLAADFYIYSNQNTAITSIETQDDLEQYVFYDVQSSDYYYFNE